MRQTNRREFMKDVGSGMLIAGVGASLATELGCSSAFAFDSDESLSFGELDPLVDLMQQTSPDQLQIKLIEKLRRRDVDLRQLIAAAALANAETFGGQDYVGYHAEMALVPALEIALEMPAERRALPVLKVLYRNTQQIQKVGGSGKKTIKPLQTGGGSLSGMGERLRSASRAGDMREAEQLFASVTDVPVNEQFNALLHTIEDDINVHRFVLAHRALELIDVVGKKQAHTMLRQCVRYCVNEERNRKARGRAPSAIRELLPRLLDHHGLLSRQLGDRDPGDEWVESMANTIYDQNETQASDAVAAALADGIAPHVIGEAIALAANQLVLRQGADRWRTHGDSAGVHSSDAANAWRNMIRVSNRHHQVAGLIVAAFHTARYRPFAHDPYPVDAHLEKVRTTDANALLGIAEESVRANDQATAAAAIHVYGDQGYSERPVFDLMRRYAVSEDGRLHAEKYYRTVVEEFATTRRAFRWRQLVALARVTASAYSYDRSDNKGHRAAGYEDACRLLNVEA